MRLYQLAIMAGEDKSIQIIGGGLAGSEAAWQAAKAGASVTLHEMRPNLSTEAHQTDQLAELVCSNSFRSDDHLNNAVGLLHEEMRRCASLIMACADANRVPAGGALAVDRTGFSGAVQAAIEANPSITIQRGEITELPVPGAGVTIVATGPLTSSALAAEIQERTGEDALAFFDAIAPIVHRDSINFDKAWFQSRYDKSAPGSDGKDYINCPLDADQYVAFVEALIAADQVAFHEWEASTPYFEGCLPIEVMAGRGPQTLAFGPMKPVGLTNPHNPTQKPKAVVQLRQDNALGTLYNLVGFQTKMRHGEQARILRMIPGLEAAEFARLGGLHRNTFINGPKLLDPSLHLKSDPRLLFAGQITGCEGYVESAAVGLLAGRFAASDVFGRLLAPPPPITALGALLGHITGGGDASSYQPMNVNFGLFPPNEPPEDTETPKNPKFNKKLRGKMRKAAIAERALEALAEWLPGEPGGA